MIVTEHEKEEVMIVEETVHGDAGKQIVTATEEWITGDFVHFQMQIPAAVKSHSCL